MLVFVVLVKQIYFEIGFQRPSNPTPIIQKFTRKIEDNTKMMHKSPHQKETIYIGWMRPLIGWVKLNCDGVWKRSDTLAGHWRASSGLSWQMNQRLLQEDYNV